VADGRSLAWHQHLVASVLRSIPTHEDEPQTIRQIAHTAAQNLDGFTVEEVQPIVDGIVVVLVAFDALTRTDGRYRCRGEIALYFLRSLAWFIANDRPIVNNWMRQGVGDGQSISALLGAAPYVPKLMEHKRLDLAGSNAVPIRRQRLACVLVKTAVDGRSYYLFEWDRVAAQYQLIGGRIHKDEEPEAAATQEFIEETVGESRQRLVHRRDFDITALQWVRPPPLDWASVSRTVGALTQYAIWVYGVRLKIDRLQLDESYRWLSVPEMLDGGPIRGRPTTDASLFRLINASLAGGLEQAPLSIRSDAVQGLREAVDSARVARRGVFIGHGQSQTWRQLADHLRDHHGYPIITIESEPRIGQSITEVLARMVETASFAILVHTAEDEQADGTLRARQNVVHETGLFQGRLGFSRTIIVRQTGCEEFSNIAGLQEVRYADDIREAFGHVVAALGSELD